MKKMKTKSNTNTLKAFFALFVMAIFAISAVPLAFAEGDSNDSAASKLTSAESGTIAGNGRVAVANVRQDTKDFVEASKENRQQLKENVKQDVKALKEGELTKEQLAQKLKEDRKSFLDSQKQTKEDFMTSLKQDRKELINQAKARKDDPKLKERTEKAKELLKMSAEKRAEGVKSLTSEQFREFQKKQMMIAVDKCKENDNIDQSICQEKLERRVSLIDTLAEKDLQRLKKIEENKNDKVEELKNISKEKGFEKFKINGEIKAREIAKDQLDLREQQYAQLEARFKTVKENEGKKNEEMQQAREKVKEACKDAASDACKAAQAELVVKAKEVLQSQAVMMLDSIQKIRTKVESSEQLSNDEAQKIIAELDVSKTAIEAAQKELETAQTKEAIIAVAKKMNDAWEAAKPKMKIHAAKIVNARIGGIVVQSKQLDIKLERMMAKMQESGIDSTAVQPLVDKYHTNIDSAKSNYELAVSTLTANKTDDATIKKANGYLQAAQKSLQDARTNLAEIVKQLRADNADSLLTDENASADDDALDSAETTVATTQEISQADTAQAAVESQVTSTTA